MAEFNLIDEPWIPCIDADGKLVEYGIRGTLINAHKLREIYDDSPLVTAAIHRLLLAILYRAFQGPSDTKRWKEIYLMGSFLSQDCLRDYLDRLYDRFFLFHENYPFMQVAELDLNDYDDNGKVSKDKTDGLMRLSRESPDKGGRVLFDHRVGTDRPEYESKQIAKMILSAQSYSGTGVASSGKIGSKSISPTECLFAPCVKGLILWIQGQSLFHTLVLNMVPHNYIEKDMPTWEDDSIISTAIQSWEKPVSFTGPIQRYAPLCRFIRVLDGKSIFFTNGLKAAADTEDPMKAYTRSDDKNDYQSIELREDKAVWRDAHTLFSLGSAVRKPPEAVNHLSRLVQDGTVSKCAYIRANIVGLKVNQGRKLLWRHERMPVPLGILEADDITERLNKLILEAEAAGEELSRGLFWSNTSKKTIRKEPVGRVQAIADLMISPSLQLRNSGILRTSEGKLPEDAHNKAVLDLADNLDPRPAYWSRMEEHFYVLLEGLPNDWDDANNTWKNDDQQKSTILWRENVKREAQRALEESIRSLGTTARAIQAVARVRTDFNDYDLNLPTQIVQKPKRELKRGKKK